MIWITSFLSPTAEQYVWLSIGVYWNVPFLHLFLLLIYWYSFLIFYNTFDHRHHGITEYWIYLIPIPAMHRSSWYLQCRDNWTASQIRDQRHLEAKKNFFVHFRSNFLTSDFAWTLPRHAIMFYCWRRWARTIGTWGSWTVRFLRMLAAITWWITQKGKRNFITQAEKLLVNGNFIYFYHVHNFPLGGRGNPRWFPVFVWLVDKLNTLIWLAPWMSSTWTGNDLFDRSSIETEFAKKISVQNNRSSTSVVMNVVVIRISRR